MIKNQALGGRANRALIFLGLFLGVVSAVLVVVYLSTSGSEGGDVSTGVVTPVVVVNDNLPIGTRLTADNLTVKELSSDAVLAGAFREIKDVEGQVTKVPLVAGEQVVPTKVTATGAAIADVENPPLAYVVPDGMRAVSVGISSVIGASGLIRPGDFVDVILTIKVEGEIDASSDATSTTLRDQIARTIIQNAQVLSIDQTVNTAVVGDGDTSPTASETDQDSNPDATTVTLAVPPVLGEVLTTAEACGQNFGGRLALSLRSFGDSSTVETRTVWPVDGEPPSCAALLGLTTLQ
jgi:pilus assembly protein CpaB